MSDDRTPHGSSGRKITRRHFLRIGVMVGAAGPLLPSLLSGCAPAPTPVPPTATTGPTRAAATATAVPATATTAANRQISMAYDDIQFWKDQAKEFTQKTGINVKYESIPFPQLHDKYLASFMSGSKEYDVVHVRDDYVVEWGSKGWLEPLNSRITDAMKQQYFPGSFDYLTYQGKIYGVPRYLWLWQFYYNTDLFQKAGLKDPPKTWAELREMAKKLTNPPQYGFIATYGDVLSVNVFTVRLRAEGGQLMKDGKPTWNTPEGVAALQSLVDLMKDGSTDPSSLEMQTTTPMSDIFTQGRAAMMFSTPPTLALAADATKSKVVGKVQVALNPGSKIPSGGYSELGGIGMVATSADKDAAWEWIKFATGAEQQKKMHLALGRIPTIPSLMQDPEILKAYPVASIVAEQMKYPMGMAVVVPQQAEVNRALANELVAALRGQKEAAKALADAETAVKKIVG